jgi:hypothetical protein
MEEFSETQSFLSKEQEIEIWALFLGAKKRREGEVREMNKKLVILEIVPLVFLLTIAFVPIDKASGSDTSFTVVWITDTQNLSQYSPADYDTACTWIVNNAAALNLKAVIHTGDIVNTDTDTSQWDNAAHSMGLLLSNNITYCWCAGNHETFVPQSYPAFNLNTMRAKPYWVSDYNGGIDTAINFNFSGQNFLVIDIEYWADNSVLQWANTLLASHPSSSVIIGTHAYLDPSSGYDSWAANFKATVLDTHANVFLTLNGHYHPAGISTGRTRVGNRDELYFDRQDLGAATIRLFTFDTMSKTIAVKTYDTVLSSFITDSDNQFTLTPSVAIPEFASWIILPFFIMAATFVVSVFGKKRNY